MVASTKVCSDCHLELPAEAFRPDARSPDGLTYTCRPCDIHRKRDKFHYKGRPHDAPDLFAAGYETAVGDLVSEIQPGLLRLVRSFGVGPRGDMRAMEFLDRVREELTRPADVA